VSNYPKAMIGWYVTTDPQTLPENSTSYVMTNISDVNYQDVGNIYGLRTWVEYGFRQCKSELGWSDFHLTNFAQARSIASNLSMASG
jgi:SRSO17 transposase